MFQDADYTVRRPADFDYAAAIADLEEQVRRKKHLQSQLTYFETETARLADVTEKRRFELTNEEADVERLRRFSPAVVLYVLTGQKEKMLAREEAEALAAAALYETAKSQLDYAASRAREIKAELRRLGNCERKLEALLEEAKQKRREQDAAFSAKTAEIEKRIKAIDREITELDEAIDKGERVRGIIRGVRNQLDNAHDLSVVDTIPIGRHPMGYLRDKEKYEYLDTARAMLDRLGQYMQEFAAELKDVAFDDSDLPDTPQIREGTRCMDLYFDSIFADFAVRRRIEGSLGEMDALAERVSPIMEQLNARKAAKSEERNTAEAELRRLVREF
jgi:exonuclease VII small subunit